MSSVTLYSSPISDCSARVRIALNLKQQEYQLVTINLKNQQNQDGHYTEINASQAVPTLVHKEAVVTQSIAAIEYLDETFPHVAPLLPADPVARAKTRTLANIIATDAHPLLTHRVGRKIEEAFPDADIKAWRLYWLERGIANFEAEVVKTAGRYCVGDEITIADVCLVPALWTAVRWQIDLSRYPTVQRVYGNLSEVKEFKAAKQDPESELDSTV